MKLVPLSSVPAAEVEALLDRAFGPDRRARTAYRVRAGLAPITQLSAALVDDAGALAGSIQCWPVALACDDGARMPLVMVGPVAVDPAIQRAGLGRRLTRHAIAAADASALPGHDVLMLVGDPEYYTRFFGFSDAATRRWRLPGPWEPRRLLARGPAPDRAGLIEGRVDTIA